MKKLIPFIMLSIIIFPMAAQESSNIVMKDFDESMEGFSFAKGGLVKMDQERDGCPMEIDFIFDMPHGLGMDNSVLTDWFSGNAGIIDLGPVSLEIDSEIPTEGFIPSLEPESIIQGHTYLIRTADEKSYGKIQIVQFDDEMVEFKWIYPVE